jgi:hypothetical protein
LLGRADKAGLSHETLLKGLKDDSDLAAVQRKTPTSSGGG